MKTEKIAALDSAGNLGGLYTEAVTEETYVDIDGLPRLSKKVEGKGTGAEFTTRYGYYGSSFGSLLHGRQKWELGPHGDFVHTTYTFNSSTSGTVTELRPWKDYAWDPDSQPSGPTASSCVKTLKTLYSDYYLDQTYHPDSGTHRLTSSSRTNWNNVLKDISRDQYGNGSTYSESARFTAATGRIAWRILTDGTAEQYAYTGASIGVNDYSIEIKKGAGNSSGVTSGVSIKTDYNKYGAEIGQTISDFGSTGSSGPTTVETWSMDVTAGEDFFGRPLKKVWNANANDYETYVFGCCGIEEMRDRQGVVTKYYRDKVHRRVWKIETIRGSSTEEFLTSYAVGASGSNSHTVETVHKAGTLEFLRSKTWRHVNGRTTDVLQPDRDNIQPSVVMDTNHAKAEHMAYSYGTTAQGGLERTTTNPDGSTLIESYYRDGQLKSRLGTAAPDTAYDYDVFPSGGSYYGTLTQVTRLTATAGTDEWIKSYSDEFGRPVKTEYPSEIAASPTKDHATTTHYASGAAAGSRGKLSSMTDPDGVTVSYEYDSRGRRTKITEDMPDSQSRVTLTAFDIVTDGTLGDCLRSTTTVNGVETGKSLMECQGSGRKTITPAGESIFTKTEPSGGAWFTSTTAPDGVERRDFYSYDRMVASTRWKDGSTPDTSPPADITAVANTGFINGTSYAYDGLGRMTTITDSRTGAVTNDSFNNAGQVTSVTSNGAADTTLYYFDAMGRTVLVDQPDTTWFDGSASQPLYNQTATSYYPGGEIKAVWGDGTYPRFHEYDEQGRLTKLRTFQAIADNSTADPNPHPHNIEPTSLTSNPSTTEWIYDGKRGWLIEKNYHGESDDGAADEDYTYTAAGRLETRDWERGITTTYGYDKGHLETTVYSDGTPDVEYTYDSHGRQLTVKQGHNTTGAPHHQWDYAYHATTLALTGETIRYDTDADGTADFVRYLTRGQDSILRPNALKLGTSSGGSQEYSLSYLYDNAGRLSKVRDFKRLSGNFFHTYNYYAGAARQVKFIQLAHRHSDNDPALGLWDETGRQWRQLEDNRDVLEWTGLGYRGDSTGNRSRYDYTTNAIGQRTAVDTSGSLIPTGTGEWDWKFNQRGEVVSADANWEPDHHSYYTFDAIGNRDSVRYKTSSSSGGVSLDYTANALNQYDDKVTLWDYQSGTTYVHASPNPDYDLDGNQTKAPLPADPGNLATLDWNGENRLEKITKADNTEIGFQYDYLGRRISKDIDGSASKWFVYDGWNMIAEYDKTSTAPVFDRRFTWGLDLVGQAGGSWQGAGGVGGLLCIYDNGTDYLPAYDGNGNVTGIVRANNGGGDGFTNVASYTYDAFGCLIDSEDWDTNGYVNENPFRFSTKYEDSETGLYYYGYRYYDPATGRWPSKDPIRERGGMNLYGFVRNNCVSLVDVLGLEENGKCTLDVDFGHWTTGSTMDPDGTGIDDEYIRDFKDYLNGDKGKTIYGGCGANYLNERAYMFGFGLWPKVQNNWLPENAPNNIPPDFTPQPGDCAASGIAGDYLWPEWSGDPEDNQFPDRDEDGDEDVTEESDFFDSIPKQALDLCGCCEEVIVRYNCIGDAENPKCGTTEIIKCPGKRN